MLAKHRRARCHFSGCAGLGLRFSGVLVGGPGLGSSLGSLSAFRRCVEVGGLVLTVRGEWLRNALLNTVQLCMNPWFMP